MEKIKETIIDGNNIKRLSIVDSIDSLYLFTYDQNEKLVSFSKAAKNQVNIQAFLRDKSEMHSEADYRLYYTSIDYEILPREMFLYGNEENYLKNILPFDKKGTIHFTDKCTEEKLVIIYPVDALHDIKMREAMRGLHTFHISTPMLKSSVIDNGILYCYVLGKQVFYLLKEAGNWIANYSSNLRNGLSASLSQQHDLYKDKVNSVVLLGDIESTELQILQQKYPFISREVLTYEERVNYIKF